MNIYIYMFFFKGFIPIHSHWYTTRLFKHIYPLLPVIQPTFPGRTNPGNMGSVEIHQSLARIHGFCIYITNTKPWMINPFSTGFKWFLWEKYYLTILSVGITTIYEGNLDPMTWRLAHVGFLTSFNILRLGYDKKELGICSVRNGSQSNARSVCNHS